MTFDTACAIFRGRDYRQFDHAADVVVTKARHGLSDSQVALLCESLAASGDELQLPIDLTPFVDVPSSGGPASLTTLLCPLLIAAFGFHVPKLSATGSIAGGIDSMGIIPGFRTKLSAAAFLSALRRSRFAHTEPTKRFCPADKNLVRKRRAANMMANPQLATASLLAKKLAMPNTCAVFDFRVGIAGNIGENVRAARAAKQLFIRIAARLGLRVDVVLTEDRLFPCSALGRLESLFLLWQIVCNRKLRQIDEDHLSLCIKIGAKACQLASNGDLEHGITTEKLRDLLRSGEVKKMFLSHLVAQGAELSGFQQLLKSRDKQHTVTIHAPATGFWNPPDLNRSKDWLKNEQKRVGKWLRTTSIEAQVGLRLCRTPGDKVDRGDTVIEFRYTRRLPMPEIPSWLHGDSRSSVIRRRVQHLG